MTIARQQDLPGMTERKLADLHEAALHFEELREERDKAKTHVFDLMHQHKIEHYKYNGVEITLTHEQKENVRVKVKAHSNEDEVVDGKMKAANDDSMPEMPAEQRRAVARLNHPRRKTAARRKAKK